MTELGPLDTGFMEMEDTDPRVGLGIGTVAIVEGPAPTREELRAWLDRGLERHGRLRQRVRRAPLDLKAPVWEDDPNFALEHHLRWTALPDPGGETELRELVATELTERLDRDHPLWEVVAPDGASSLNGPIGRQRRYAVARTTLTQIQEIASAFDVTSNDVAVATIAAAYRRVLLNRGEHPTATTLRIVVSVSTRTPETERVLDNRPAAVISYLPVDTDHPVERLRTVHEQIRRHRSRGEVEAEKSLLWLSRRLPFGVVAEVFRLALRFPQRGVGALATDIPGPRHRLTLGGREVVELWPCIPIALRVRTTIAILNYRDRLTFGITGDYDTAPDIDMIASGISTEIAVLLAHARGQQQQRRPHSVAGSADEFAAGRSRRTE